MSRHLKRLKAKLLYVEEGKSHEEIAALVGVSETTVRSWSRKDGWETDREAMLLTDVTAYKQMLLMAVKQLQKMAAAGEIDPDKVDVLHKVIRTAKMLGRDIDRRGNILLGLNEFVEFLRELHPDALGNLQPYLIEFGSWVKRKYP